MKRRRTRRRIIMGGGGGEWEEEGIGGIDDVAMICNWNRIM